MQPPATLTEPGRAPSGAGPVGDWLTPGRFALLLGVLIFAGFPQVVLGLQTFVYRDYGFFAYPLAAYQRECFWRGELPFWNPYNNCGVPFLAQWNTMPLYPPALIYLLLPLSFGLGCFTLAHLFWAGLGMYFLAHHWTGNRLGAALVGVVFAFNGLSLNLLMWPSHIATFSWMPWVVWSVEAALCQGGRKVVLAALVGALQMLAGGPETILFTWLICLVLLLTGCTRERAGVEAEGKSPWPAALWRFPVIVLLVAGLAAAQLLPFLDLASHSERQAGYADARWSMPGWGWVNFLVPMAFGMRWNKGCFFQYDQAWTSSYYLGIGALLLAVLAAASMKDRRVRVLALGGGLGVMLAFGDQFILTRWLRQAIPQLSLMTYPVKYVILAVFAAPLLAAYAAQRLQQADEGRHLKNRLLPVAVVLVALIGAILFWGWRWPFPTDDFGATLENGVMRALFLAAIVWVLLALRRGAEAGMAAAGAGWRRFLPALLLLLVWLDVWSHVPPQNPTVAPWIYAPDLARQKLAMQPQPELGRSRAMVSPAAESQFFRFIASDPKDNFLVKRLGYFADCNLLDHVPKVNGFFSLYPRECGDLGSVLYGSTNASYPRLEEFMGVSQVSAPGRYYEWEPRAGFLPLVTAGQRPVFVDATNELRAVLAGDFDGRALAIFGEDQRRWITVAGPAAARVVSTRVEPEAVEARVEADGAALVVLAQTWYHRWRAFVDGQPAPLLRANYAFQAVQVPKGSHHVRVVYVDRPFQVGAVVFGLTLLGCVMGWMVCRRKRMG